MEKDRYIYHDRGIRLCTRNGKKSTVFSQSGGEWDAQIDEKFEEVYPLMYDVNTGLPTSWEDRIQNHFTTLGIYVDKFESSGNMEELEKAEGLADFLMTKQHANGGYYNGSTDYTSVIYPAKSIMEYTVDIGKKAGEVTITLVPGSDKAIVYVDGNRVENGKGYTVKVDAAVAELEKAVAAVCAEDDSVKGDDTFKKEDDSEKAHKVASDNAGSKTNLTGNTAAKTGDVANAAIPAAAGLAAILVALLRWKKK